MKKSCSSSNVGVSLDFVEEEECFAWNKFLSWIDEGNTADDGAHSIPVRRDCSIFRFFNEVDSHHRTIVAGSKMIDSFRFPDLTGAFDDKRSVVRVGFPCVKIVISFALEVHESAFPNYCNYCDFTFS